MKRTSKRGFTLLEMVVVLGVIALVTHLAVRELGQWRSLQLVEVSNRTLEEVREAVVGSEFERDEQGVRVRRGFVADMGRLPMARTNRYERLSLIELWQMPEDGSVLPYRLRQAVTNNFVKGVDADHADKDIWVGSGWRGPYIRLPLGRARLIDGWGNPFEVPDETGYELRLLGEKAGEAVTNGGYVVGMRHLGSDGVPDDRFSPQTYSEMDSELLFGSAHSLITNCTLRVELELFKSNGERLEVASGIVRVYEPSAGWINVRSENFNISNGYGTAMIDGLTPGMRKVRVKYGDSGKSAPCSVVIQPGDNEISLREIEN